MQVLFFDFLKIFACGVLPAREMGAREMGAREMGAREMGARGTGAKESRAPQGAQLSRNASQM